MKKHVSREHEDFPDGYPKLSRLLDNDDAFMYKSLSIRIARRLLSEKDGLDRMEELLNRMAKMDDDKNHGPFLKSQTLDTDRESLPPSWPPHSRVHIVEMIKEQALEYNSNLQSYKRMAVVNYVKMFDGQVLKEREGAKFSVRSQFVDRHLPGGRGWPAIRTGQTILAQSDSVDRQLPARRDLPMIIKGRTILAQPDSGAENCNIISSSLTSEFQLRIKTGKSDCRSFKMGNGKIVRAVGRVRVPCTFARDTETKVKCSFYVFKNLAVPLIMGTEFLKITRTLTEFTHRLVDRLPFTGNTPSVNLIGSPTQSKQRLSALLDGRVTYFNADSGCQVGDLMSPAYARMHGYKIDRTEECRKRLIFADGTVAQTIGQVTATLSMQNGDSYLKVFDVLPELISDVVLGEATLAQIDAFKVHSDSFVDVFDGDHHLELAILVSLGSISQFLAYHFRAVFAKQKTRDQYQPSQAKQRDDEMMKEILAEDAAKLRQQRQNHRTVVSQGSATG